MMFKIVNGLAPPYLTEMFTSNNALNNYGLIYICYLPAGRSVSSKTVTEVLKMLPKAAGRGQHFQARGHSFSRYGPTQSR